MNLAGIVFESGKSMYDKLIYMMRTIEEAWLRNFKNRGACFFCVFPAGSGIQAESRCRAARVLLYFARLVLLLRSFWMMGEPSCWMFRATTARATYL